MSGCEWFILGWFLTYFPGLPTIFYFVVRAESNGDMTRRTYRGIAIVFIILAFTWMFIPAMFGFRGCTP